MNTNELISSLVNSLAWPVAIVVIIFLLKSPIQRLILNLSRFKFNELEMDFAAALEEVKEIMPVKTDVQIEKDPNIIEMAKLNPSSAILISFNKIEHELAEVIKRLAISPDYPGDNSVHKNIKLISSYTDINEDTLEILNDLRHLRNIAAHSNPNNNITYTDAIKFYNLSESLIVELKNLQLTNSY